MSQTYVNDPEESRISLLNTILAHSPKEEVEYYSKLYLSLAGPEEKSDLLVQMYAEGFSDFEVRAAENKVEYTFPPGIRYLAEKSEFYSKKAIKICGDDLSRIGSNTVFPKVVSIIKDLNGRFDLTGEDYLRIDTSCDKDGGKCERQMMLVFNDYSKFPEFFG